MSERPKCPKCGDTGTVEIESGVIGPEGQREMLQEPCDCPAGDRAYQAWLEAEASR